MKIFKCPKCGGRYFGAVILWVRRRGVLMVEGWGTMRVGDEVAKIKYRCHCTINGADDVTGGASLRIERGSHAIWPGASGQPCGWETDIYPSGENSDPPELFVECPD